MIDLSTCVSGQKVRFANGKTGEVCTSTRWSGPIKLRRVRADNNGWWWCTLDGIPDDRVQLLGWEIVEILPLNPFEEQPMIDLSTCTPGQKVKYRDGSIGTFVGLNGKGQGFFPFFTEAEHGNTQSHTKGGKIIFSVLGQPRDVVGILPLETPAEQPGIDLSTCVLGQKVRFQNGKIGLISSSSGRSGTTELRSVKVGEDRWQWYTLEGLDYNNDLPDPKWRIVEILPVETPEEQPTIDLSTCVPGQKVRFQNGQIGFVSTSRRRSGNTEMQGVGCNLNWSWYTLDGIQGKDLPDPEWRIVEILPVETHAEQPMPEPTPTPQEINYKSAYLQISSIISVAFPECEVSGVDMARLLINENRTLRLALGLPTYEQVDSLTCTETRE